MKKGRLYVISGPSAVGKGTIVRRIIEESDSVALSVSATTRSPRSGEENGVHYFFLTHEEFRKKINEGGFLEYAEVHGNYYGTPLEPVRRELEKGRDIILEIDVQGGDQVKSSGINEATFIMIMPPSMESLRSRILFRGSETPEAVELRLGKAMAEMERLSDYDYYVVNDDLETAIMEVKSIIAAEHNRVSGRADEILKVYREENS